MSLRRSQFIDIARSAAGLPSGAEARTDESALLDRLRGGLTIREAPISAGTINEAERMVSAVVATESRVRAIDVERWRIIEEILLIDGATWDEPCVLLESHSRWSTEDVLGSVHKTRRENDALVSDLEFGEDGGRADRAWSMTRQKHLRNVSLGAIIKASVMIEPGESVTVAGRVFTAGEVALRVVTEWHLREVSLVIFGADALAKIRRQFMPAVIDTSAGQKQQGGADRAPISMRNGDMNFTQAQLEMLRSLGLAEGATEDDAARFYQGLDESRRNEVDAVARKDSPSTPQPSTAPATDIDRKLVDEALSEAIRAERVRTADIRRAAGDEVPQEIVDRAIDDGWPVDRAYREFLPHVRAARNESSQQVHGYRGGYDHGERCTEQTLGIAVAMRGGIDPMRAHVKNSNGRAVRPETDAEREERSRLADYAQRYAQFTLLDICREACRLSRVNVPHDRTELIRAAVSTSALSYIFTTSAYASLMQSFTEAPDTSAAWTRAVDVPNFLTQERIGGGKVGGLQKLPIGGTAKDVAIDDRRETYKLARYAEKFTMDERDFIDDNVGLLASMPVEMGLAARRMVPDLAYALLLANPTLADTGALFNATAVTTAGGHANLTTAVLGITGLQAAITAVEANNTTSADGKLVRLNNRPKFLVVPPVLKWTALTLLTSAEYRDTTASTKYATKNVLADQDLSIISEGRIDATGVFDPSAETQRTGSATNWFLLADPMVTPTVEIAYLAGTNRAPQLRSYVLNQGQWGMGFDINFDVVAAALGYHGMHKSTGAG